MIEDRRMAFTVSGSDQTINLDAGIRCRESCHAVGPAECLAVAIEPSDALHNEIPGNAAEYSVLPALVFLWRLEIGGVGAPEIFVEVLHLGQHPRIFGNAIFGNQDSCTGSEQVEVDALDREAASLFAPGYVDGFYIGSPEKIEWRARLRTFCRLSV